MSQVCKYCNEATGSHDCPVAERFVSEDNSGDFILAAVIAYATDSALLGGLLGGSLEGGIIGDLLDGDLLD